MIKEIRNNQPDNVLRIEYMPGNLCNYRCNYCFPGSNEGDKPWPDVELVKQNLSHLLSHYARHGKTKSDIFIVGGEPTLWKELENLCLYLKENFDVILEMSTNGSRKVPWWQKNAGYFDHIGVSVHNDFAKLDHIIEVCDALYERGVFVNADVLMDPLCFDKCMDNVEYLKRSKYEWPIIAKIVHYNGQHRYNQTQLKYFQDSIKRYPSPEWYNKTARRSQRLVTITREDEQIIETNDDGWITRNKLNYFKGWKCNLGVDLIKIFPNGTITGNCQQLLYGKDFYYNLHDPNFSEIFNPEIKPVTCSKLICGCNEEVVCDKIKYE